MPSYDTVNKMAGAKLKNENTIRIAPWPPRSLNIVFFSARVRAPSLNRALDGLIIFLPYRMRFKATRKWPIEKQIIIQCI